MPCHPSCVHGAPPRVHGGSLSHDSQGTCAGAMCAGKQLGAASMQQPRADQKLFVSHFRSAMWPCGATFPLRSLRANCRAGLRTSRTGGFKHLELSDRDRVK